MAISSVNWGEPICTPCAEGAGAVWPDGHVATWNQDKCGTCGKETAVCHPDDFNWPGKRPPFDRD